MTGAGADGAAIAGPRALGLAGALIGELTARRQTLAVAESLTGGLLAATLTAIPGASVVFRGGVVCYATAVKESVLGVPGDLLARHGAVHPEVAAALAAGVRALLGSSLGAGTTGVAGPDPSDGQPVGTVYIAASGADTAIGRALALEGGRQEIRVATVERSLELLLGLLREDSG